MSEVLFETTDLLVLSLEDVLPDHSGESKSLTMLDTIELDFGETPETMMGDGAYGTGPNLEAMEERGIELLSPAVREEKQDNPALRDDLTQPVADEDLDRLPISPQTKRFDKQAFV